MKHSRDAIQKGSDRQGSPGKAANAQAKPAYSAVASTAPIHTKAIEAAVGNEHKEIQATLDRWATPTGQMCFLFFSGFNAASTGWWPHLQETRGKSFVFYQRFVEQLLCAASAYTLARPGVSAGSWGSRGVFWRNIGWHRTTVVKINTLALTLPSLKFTALARDVPVYKRKHVTDQHLCSKLALRCLNM